MQLQAHALVQLRCPNCVSTVTRMVLVTPFGSPVMALLGYLEGVVAKQIVVQRVPISLMGCNKCCLRLVVAKWIVAQRAPISLIGCNKCSLHSVVPVGIMLPISLIGQIDTWCQDWLNYSNAEQGQFGPLLGPSIWLSAPPAGRLPVIDGSV